MFTLIIKTCSVVTALLESSGYVCLFVSCLLNFGLGFICERCDLTGSFFLCYLTKTFLAIFRFICLFLCWIYNNADHYYLIRFSWISNKDKSMQGNLFRVLTLNDIAYYDKTGLVKFELHFNIDRCLVI